MSLSTRLVADRAGERTAAREAVLAAAAVRAGGSAPGVVVCRPGRVCAVDGVSPSARDVASVALPGYVRHGRRGRVAFALAAAGESRLVLVVLDRGGAMERQERIGLLIALVTVLAGTLGWAIWAGASYARRLSRVARVARTIADGDLSARAALNGRDELGVLGRDVDRMAERLGALERARSEFVAKVSHDLRTPLTVIKGYAFTLHRGATDDAERRRLAAIGRETDRLTALVDDLLTLSQAGAGALRVTIARVGVGDLLDEVAERIAPLASERDVALVVECPLELELDGDRRRLGQVLTNLATNAVRHTPARGSVRLSAFPRGSSAVLRVEDTGSGIDPALVERLLRPFERGDGPASGTGLGLAIASELVAAHDGRLQLEPRTGGGTVATVELPRRATRARALAGVR